MDHTPTEKSPDNRRLAALTPQEKQTKAQEILDSEPKKSLLTRQWLLGSFLFLYVIIGVPCWFVLTEIYRAQLPSNFITALYQNQNIDIKIQNDIYLRVGDSLKFPDLPEATQIQIDSEIQKLINDPISPLTIQWNASVKLEDEIPKDSYILDLELGQSEGIAMDGIDKIATLIYRLESVKNNDLPFFVTQTVLQHVFKTELELFKSTYERSINAIAYSPNVHLSFKLLTGDGNPMAWEIGKALDDYFTPLVEELKSFVNFTIDTEIKYYTELNLPEGSHQIKTSDLSTLLDFSEWDISSNQFSYPTLNFVVYFPSEKQAPLNIHKDLTRQSPMAQNAFLIPQWGSIILHENPLQENSLLTAEYLNPLLEIFTSELFTLLGLPKDPKTPRIRIDAIKKYTIISNLNRAVDSLQSLLKLSESLPNISIPKTVLNNVKKSLEARERAVEKINKHKDFNGALVDSIEAMSSAEEAFFDPEMVQQTFFPQEHKVAVYMPLIGPLSLIMILGTIRVLKEYKIYRKKRD
ncbi:GPI transamidase component GPI17 [Cyberlindnera fabianii]|uniref:GPI transamidase component GPI17 n=1 Tax=Cyberlindnera fabianii TaxID=36022 RepID=A0A1V2L1V3_CYBFA|nr:GPI transamidase component GPI17 [Cyberlindnera fabianii]